jgi:Protein of unknown function (DUF3187)
MRRVAVISLLLLWATASAAEENVVAHEFTGYGPIPVRNFQPIQLIFLNLPFERARVQPHGHFELHLETAESNEIATNQGDVEATLKFETNRTVLGGSVGVGHDLEIGLDVPIISRFGGFLDPFIDSVEDLFGNFNPERTLFPNNSFGGFQVQRGGVTLFDGKDQSFNLGDIWMSGKYQLWQREGWPLVSLRPAIKFPTGRAGGVYGSGKPDFGLGLAAEQQFLPWLVTYLNLALIYPVGPITDADLTLNPIVTQGVAFEARLFRPVSVLVQQELYTSPMHGNDTGLLDGTVVELTGGLNVAVQPLLFQLGVIDNVSGVITAADFTVMLRMTYLR